GPDAKGSFNEALQPAMKAVWASAEELTTVDVDGEAVGGSALNAQWSARPPVPACCDKAGGVKCPSALRTTRREPRGGEWAACRLGFTLDRVAARAPGRRLERVNDLGSVIDEVVTEVELHLVIAIVGVRGVVEGEGFEGIAEAARAQ